MEKTKYYNRDDIQDDSFGIITKEEFEDLKSNQFSPRHHG